MAVFLSLVAIVLGELFFHQGEGIDRHCDTCLSWYSFVVVVVIIVVLVVEGIDWLEHYIIKELCNN